MIGPPDDPEDPLLEASAERGRGGGKQEGGTVPPHPERADRGEGDEHPAAEAAARSAPADKVHTRTHTHFTVSCSLLSYTAPSPTPLLFHNRRKETLSIRQTLDSLKLNLSVDDEDEDQPAQQEETVTKV